MSSFYHNLRQEFESLSQIRQSNKYTAEHGPPPPPPPEQAAAAHTLTITPAADQNIGTIGMDNAAATATITTTQEPAQQQQRQTQEEPQHIANVPSVQFVSFQTELYPKIHPTLSKKLPLKNVKYKSRLNGNEAIIPKLPVELQHVNANLVHQSVGGNDAFFDNNANGNTSNGLNVTAPYCRVYIIHIESTEEYRSTIKPVLKKWVSDREKAKEKYLIVSVDEYASSPGTSVTNNNITNGGDSSGVVAANNTNDGASASSHHNHNHSNGSDAVVVPNQTNSAVSKIAAFRNRLAGGMEGNNKKGGEDQAGGSSSQTAPAAKHQLAKELFRRLSYDFGASKTAMVSHVSLFKKDSSLWNKFLSQLGLAIVAAFEHRSAILDEKLRRMLDQRVKDKQGKWNFSDFFMLKEKLACTFEHLQLEREALLQYEELGVFVFAEPDLPIAKAATGERMDVGNVTDPTDFLLRLEQKQVTAQELYQHLFERESHFNFLLSRPIEALVLARRFIVSSYKRFLENPHFTKTVSKKTFVVSIHLNAFYLGHARINF